MESLIDNLGEICANFLLLTWSCGPLENAPRAKCGPRARVCGSLT